MTAVQEAPAAPVARAPVKRKAKEAAAPADAEAAAAVTEEAAAAEAPPAEITKPVTLSQRGNNVASVEGFLAEYDHWAGVFHKNHGWCYLEYAYENSSHRYGNKIPWKDLRTRQTFGLTDTPWEHLNDLGKAAAIEAERETLSQLYESLIKAVEYGCSSARGYLRIDEANMALASFGLPLVEKEQAYDGYASAALYFSTETRMDPLTTEQKQQVQAALSAALTAAMDEIAGKATGCRVKGQGYGTDVNISVERRQTDRIRKTGGGEMQEGIARLIGKPVAAAAIAA